MTTPLATSATKQRWLVRSDTQAKLTLEQMRRLVRAAWGNREWLTFARGVLRSTGADTRSQSQMAFAIREYVARRIQFVGDPVGIENLTPPLDHMRQLEASRGPILGDCDDAATLAAALAGAVGIPSTFTIRAFDWGHGATPYQHVFTTLLPRGAGPVVVDTTRDAQKFPPKISRELTVRV